MLFNSVTFLVLFLPVSLLVYYLLGYFQMNAAKFWLVAVSFLFYGWWNPQFLTLLIISILFNYICGYLIQIFEERPRGSSFFLTIGIVVNLGAAPTGGHLGEVEGGELDDAGPERR